MRTFLSKTLSLCAVAFVFGPIGEANVQGQNEGSVIWTNYFSGPDFNNANAIAVDSSGNVFVTGESGFHYATVKHSASGLTIWTNLYEGAVATALAVDRNGNVIVTGAGYSTIKYSGDGMPLWTNRYTGPELGEVFSTAVTVNSTGDVFVTGYLERTNFSGQAQFYRDYMTIKYSEAGMPLWTNRYSGLGNDDNQAWAIAVDGNSGNVFATGRSVGIGSGDDYATIAYSDGGLPLWTNRYNGALTNSSDSAIATMVNSNGIVFVTGSSTGNGGALDYVTIAYSGEGVALWTNRFDGSGSGDDIATSLAVDGDGNVFVTGRSWGEFMDYATIKYSGAGVSLWTNRYGGKEAGWDLANAVAVDSRGNVFVTGVSDEDYATVAYSGNGIPLWTNRYDGFDNQYDRASALAVDSAGNVLVTGRAFEMGGYVYTTFKYSSVIPPLLTITITTTNTVTVAWPSLSVGYSLQQNTNGPVTENWNSVTETPTDNGATKSIILDAPTGNNFFRLVHP